MKNEILISYWRILMEKLCYVILLIKTTFKNVDHFIAFLRSHFFSRPRERNFHPPTFSFHSLALMANPSSLNLVKNACLEWYHDVLELSRDHTPKKAFSNAFYAIAFITLTAVMFALLVPDQEQVENWSLKKGKLCIIDTHVNSF